MNELLLCASLYSIHVLLCDFDSVITPSKYRYSDLQNDILSKIQYNIAK